MSIQYIPLSTTDYDSTRTVNLDGSVFNLRVYYVTRDGFWYLDLADSQENDLLLGQRMITGCDLLSTCNASTAPPGVLFIPGGVDPGINDLGVNCFLCYASIADLAAIQAGTYGQ